MQCDTYVFHVLPDRRGVSRPPRPSGEGDPRHQTMAVSGLGRLESGESSGDGKRVVGFCDKIGGWKIHAVTCGRICAIRSSICRKNARRICRCFRRSRAESRYGRGAARATAVKAFLTAGGRVIAGEKSGECDYFGVRCRQRPLEGLAGMPEAVQIPFNDWRGDRRIVAEDALNARVHGCCRGAYECCLKVG